MNLLKKNVSRTKFGYITVNKLLFYFQQKRMLITSKKCLEMSAGTNLTQLLIPFLFSSFQFLLPTDNNIIIAHKNRAVFSHWRCTCVVPFESPQKAQFKYSNYTI